MHWAQAALPTMYLYIMTVYFRILLNLYQAQQTHLYSLLSLDLRSFYFEQSWCFFFFFSFFKGSIIFIPQGCSEMAKDYQWGFTSECFKFPSVSCLTWRFEPRSIDLCALRKENWEEKLSSLLFRLGFNVSLILVFRLLLLLFFCCCHTWQCSGVTLVLCSEIVPRRDHMECRGSNLGPSGSPECKAKKALLLCYHSSPITSF